MTAPVKDQSEAPETQSQLTNDPNLTTISLSTLSVPESNEPHDNRIHKIIKMDTPEYNASLTDPMAEVDECFRGLKRVCDRYGLAYFLMVSHPGTDGTVKHQFRCDVVKPATANQLYSGIDLQLDAISKGRMRLMQIEEDTDA